MPELPEVETVVRQVKLEVCGKTIDKICVLDEIVFKKDKEVKISQFYHAKIKNVCRKGKYLMFELENELMMVVHLRMTGMLLFHPSDRLKKFLRLEFVFRDGSKMYYSDVRRFGKVWLTNVANYLDFTGMKKLGPDAYLELPDVEYLNRIFKRSKSSIKNKLLDQRILAGIGNIYADEICFRLGIRPGMAANKLSKKRIGVLLAVVKEVLEEGIKHNGTTISDFVGTRGDAGKHQKYLRVYGRTGDPCYVCDSKIVKTRVAGRGTYYCATCQKS